MSDPLAWAIAQAERAKERAAEEDRGRAIEAANQRRLADLARKDEEALEAAAKIRAALVQAEPAKNLAWMKDPDKRQGRKADRRAIAGEKAEREREFLLKKQKAQAERAEERARRAAKRQATRRARIEAWEAKRKERIEREATARLAAAAKVEQAKKENRRARAEAAERRRKANAAEIQSRISQRTGVAGTEKRLSRIKAFEAKAAHCVRRAADYFGVAPDEILGLSRKKRVGWARTTAGLIMFIEGLGYDQVATALGRDRSTVYAYRQSQQEEVWVAMENLTGTKTPAEGVIEAALLDGDEWLELAILALDQYGSSAQVQDKVRKLVCNV